MQYCGAMFYMFAADEVTDNVATDLDLDWQDLNMNLNPDSD